MVCRWDDWGTVSVRLWCCCGAYADLWCGVGKRLVVLPEKFLFPLHLCDKVCYNSKRRLRWREYGAFQRRSDVPQGFLSPAPVTASVRAVTSQ